VSTSVLCILVSRWQASKLNLQISLKLLSDLVRDPVAFMVLAKMQYIVMVAYNEDTLCIEIFDKHTSMSSYIECS
jgi:hypothetical protein